MVGTNEKVSRNGRPERTLLQSLENRRLGLEQEFFLVDYDGILSERVDEFLEACHTLAGAEGADEECFAPECVLSTVEISTSPTNSLGELEAEYLENLRLALRAAHGLGLRLYPLATYPLSIQPTLRAEAPYLAQALTMGQERFRHAGRCTGVHLHLEMPEGILDPETGVAPEVSGTAARELLGAYNLATALDPAIVALTRSCPFYQGAADGLAARTAHYRGSPDFAPYGLYAALPAVGELRPYADTPAELAALQMDRHRAWISTVEGSGIDSRLFDAGGPLKTAWNPVRLNAQDGLSGTLELRGIDSSYPSEVMAIASLVTACQSRIRAEALAVLPTAGLAALEVRGETLRVPAFERLSGPLLREAATRGLESPEVTYYLDSVFEFAGYPPEAEGLREARGYRNVEREMLARLSSEEGRRSLSRDEGLSLVRAACDELENQVEPCRQPRRKPAEVGPL